jgi:GntR family transcriptional regulator / MocR family aminotransferase
VEAAAARGVVAQAGDRYFDRAEAGERFLRLGISSIPLNHIQPGIRELSAAVGRRSVAA